MSIVWPINAHIPPLASPVTCPHCLGAGRRFTCCACVNVGAIAEAAALIRAVAFVWRRPGCRCETCARLPPVPHGGLQPAHP